MSSSRANPLTILQIAGAARAGGGEQVALRLHQAYGARGHRSWLGLGSSEHEAGIAKPSQKIRLLRMLVLRRGRGWQRRQYLGDD